MATPVVASTTVTTGSGVTSVAATKPTGLAEGDLLIAHAYIGDDTEILTSENITPPSGWTSEATASTTSTHARTKMVLFWKFATSGDAAASTFTFSISDSFNAFHVVLFRITSTGSFPSDPIISIVTDLATGSTATPSHAFSLPVFTADALLIGGCVMAIDTNGTSGYTASGTNPSWTEVTDYDDGGGYSWFSIYGDATSNNELTSLSYTQGQSQNGDRQLIMIVLAEQADATGTNNFLVTTPTLFANAAAEVGTTGTNDYLDPSPTFPSQSGKGTAPTQWTNPDKPSTNWTNPDKL